MTLWIDVFTRNGNTGEMVSVELEAGKYLFGFEVCRHQLWGADVMRSLDLNIIPRLKNGIDLVLEGEELDQAEIEIQIILQNLTLISQKTSFDEEFIRFRAQNLIDAIQIAQEIGGGVAVG